MIFLQGSLHHGKETHDAKLPAVPAEGVVQPRIGHGGFLGGINVFCSYAQGNEHIGNDTVQINSGVGEVKVILPENVPISLNCNAGVGTTHCDIGDLAAHNEGLSGEMLNISVSSGIGDVAVEFAEN